MNEFPELTIVHNIAASRFEADVRGEPAECVYRRDAGVVTFTHTEVPAALQGRGIAAELVRAALDWARAEGLRVVPACSYVARYLQRHPQSQDLL